MRVSILLWVDHMVNALFFGSTGVLAEKLHLKFSAKRLINPLGNMAWIGIGISQIIVSCLKPGGKRRLKEFSNVSLMMISLIASMLEKKASFMKISNQDLAPRDGVIDCINNCREKGIKIGFVTTTSQNNIDALEEAFLTEKNRFQCLT